MRRGMAASRRSFMIYAGIALMAVAILVRVSFGATLSQAAAGGGLVLSVWAATIGPFLGGLYLLVVGSKSRKLDTR